MTGQPDDAYRDGIAELYHGEIIGEGLFSELLATCAPEHRPKMALLLQFETEAKARLRPMLARRRIPLAEPEAARQGGIDFARTLAALPWRDAMRSLADLSQPYLDRYRLLKDAALPEDLGDIGFMVEHEHAVVRFAQLEADGRPDVSTEAVNALIERPLVFD